MEEKDKDLRCWCFKNFLVRFDDEVAPNKISGGICTAKRKECSPYSPRCDYFYIKLDLLPITKELHSADAYAKRNGLSALEEWYNTKKVSKDEI